MDPNSALTSILNGHMMYDHAEALQDWLCGRGFAPEVQLLPVDCHEFFAAYRDRYHLNERGGMKVKANCMGLYAQAVEKDDSWHLVASWRELMKLEDSVY